MVVLFTIIILTLITCVGLYSFNENVYFKKVTCKRRFLDYIFGIILTVLIALGATFVFFSDWFKSYVGNITPQQFIYNLVSSTEGMDKDSFMSMFFGPILSIILSVLVYVIFISSKHVIVAKTKDKEVEVLTLKLKYIISVAASVSFGIVGTAYGFNKLGLNEIVEEYLNQSTYIEDNYVNPKNVSLKFPEKKRNLIHIYLESVEVSYLNKELGGYMDVNLMPELTELSEEGVSFSQDKKFGGPYTTHASEWSVAGMVNMSSGVPLKTYLERNAYGLNGVFLPGLTTLGDILNSEGYNQTFMVGCEAAFGGLDAYYKTHGNYKIFDLKSAKEDGLLPKDYKVWWGFEDEKLYKYAKEEILRLSKEDKPFNFTMSTADTHFPDGYLSSKAEIKHDSQYANVISHSTKEAVEFIRWIQEQPFYENTTIVITGDHPSMDTKFFENFDKDYERKVFNLILNAPIEAKKTTNREFAPFDLFPTILASLGVNIEGDRLGLGTNLYSDKETLIERDGLNVVNENLEKYSKFFNHEFLKNNKK